MTDPAQVLLQALGHTEQAQPNQPNTDHVETSQENSESFDPTQSPGYLEALRATSIQFTESAPGVTFDSIYEMLTGAQTVLHFIRTGEININP